MYKTIVFNGKYMIKKNVRGVQRYNKEVLHALDKFIKKGSVKVLVPKSATNLDSFNNIEIVKYGGRITGFLWQNFGFQIYIWKEKAFSVCLSDGIPFFSLGLYALHDVRFLDDVKKDLKYAWKLRTIFERFFTWVGVHFSSHLITVSEFSKREIVSHYHISENKITVCYNAWQHIRMVKQEDNIFDNHPEIMPGKYYFVLGGRADNKNLKWVMMMAKKYPDRQFVLAGPSATYAIIDQDVDMNKINNCIYVGYITDGQIKSLMSNCRAFLFPSKYEGFGIPPLEALACGAKVFVSNSTCLPEIYQNFVPYFDPNDYSVDLDQLEKQKCPAPTTLLDFYSWDNTALKILTLIEKYSGIKIRK